MEAISQAPSDILVETTSGGVDETMELAPAMPAVGVDEASSSTACCETTTSGGEQTTVVKPVGVDTLDDAQLSSRIAMVLKGLDLATMTLKHLRAALEIHLGLEPGEVDEHAERIKGLAAAEIGRIHEEEAEEKEKKEVTTPLRKSKRKRKFNLAKMHYVKMQAEKKRRKEAGEDDGAKKLTITASEFQCLAKPLSVQIGDTKIEVPPKSFQTGTSGFFALQVLPIKVGDEVRHMQCLIQCAVVGSKADDVTTPENQEAPQQNQEATSQ